MFKFFLNKNITLLVILLSVLVVLLFLVAFFMLSIAKKSSLKKKAKAFKQKVDDLNIYAEDTFKIYLKRLEVIAKNNANYNELYEKYKITRDAIVVKYKNLLNTKSDEIIELIAEKKYKSVKDKIQQAELIFINYSNQIYELGEDIQKYLAKDDESHDICVKYKASFAEIKNIYHSNADELIYVEDAINKMFKKIESIFQEYEAKCNEASYQEAKELISVLDKVLPKLKSSLSIMPNLCLRLYIIIANKINDIKNRQEEFENLDYPLHHMRINYHLDEMNKKIEVLKNKLNTFSVKNFDLEINELDDQIKLINDSFDEEMSSREFFDNNNQKVYEFSSELGKRFIKVKRTMPNYKEIYCVQPKYESMILTLQEKIQDLDKTKREFDNFVHSSSARYPYSILKNKLCELIKENESIDNDLNVLNSYLKSLQTDANEAYKVLNNNFLSLKQLELKLSRMNIKTINDEYADLFVEGYKYLNDIGKYLSLCPINMEETNYAVSKIIEIEQVLNQGITKFEEDLKNAEDAIFNANKYRQFFSDAQVNLKKAEDLFFVHDFEQSFKLAAETIKKTDPKYRTNN